MPPGCDVRNDECVATRGQGQVCVRLNPSRFLEVSVFIFQKHVWDGKKLFYGREQKRRPAFASVEIEEADVPGDCYHSESGRNKYVLAVVIRQEE